MSNAPVASATIALALCFVVLGVGCKDDSQRQADHGAPPPRSPPPSPTLSASASAALASVCAPPAAGIGDAKVASLLPATVVVGATEFCVLRRDAVRSWGEGTKNPKIEDVSDLIDGSGELYSRDFFARRYDSLKYVDGRGNEAAIDVALTTYERPENAYALFTYRVVSNADPDPEVMRKSGRRPFRALQSGGAAALGNASAIVWSDNHLVELTYSPDPSKTLAEATAEGDAILPKLVEAIGGKMAASTGLPDDVRALPSEAEGRIPLGIAYFPPKFVRPEGQAEALRLDIPGGYASAYMREGEKRYRVLAIAREDFNAARDAFSVFRGLPGMIAIKDKDLGKDLGDDAVYFPFAIGRGGAGAAAKAEGIAARRGALILAIVDEELALGDPSSKGPYPRMTKEEKVAKLRKLFDARAASPH